MLNQHGSEDNISALLVYFGERRDYEKDEYVPGAYAHNQSDSYRDAYLAFAADHGYTGRKPEKQMLAGLPFEEKQRLEEATQRRAAAPGMEQLSDFECEKSTLRANAKRKSRKKDRQKKEAEGKKKNTLPKCTASIRDIQQGIPRKSNICGYMRAYGGTGYGSQGVSQGPATPYTLGFDTSGRC